MTCFVFRWGREKYSKGREVGDEGEGSGGRGGEVGVRGREAGVGDPHVHPHSKRAIFVLLASAGKTYIGSVLFRASALRGAKFASGVLAVIGLFGP